MSEQNTGNMVICNDGELELNISVAGGTVWLSQKQLGQLFGVKKQNASLHVSLIFKDNELWKDSTGKFLLVVENDSKHLL